MSNTGKKFQTKHKMTLANLEDCGLTLERISRIGVGFRENGLTVLGQVRLFLADDYQEAIGSADDLVNKLNNEIGSYNSTVKSRLEEWERKKRSGDGRGKREKMKNEIVEDGTYYSETGKNSENGMDVFIPSKHKSVENVDFKNIMIEPVENVKIETDELAKFDYDDDYFNQYYNGPEIPELDIPFRLIHKNIVEIVKSKRDLENN